MTGVNLEAVEGPDHMTDPIYDVDGWYVATIKDLIMELRSLRETK